MNTGSEYGAIRQVAFAGDRVVVVFGTGFAPSLSSKDKWPLSTYKLMSLDVKTGAKRNEITFQGRWGDMPYICSSQSRFIFVQTHPSRLLNADLTLVADLGGTSSADRTTTREQPGCDTRYDPPVNVQLYLGSYAGASANGQRFAMQSSYTEGDSPVVIYEYFTIYSVLNGNALATIYIKDLPTSQSWSAFSPNGRYFVRAARTN